MTEHKLLHKKIVCSLCKNSIINQYRTLIEHQHREEFNIEHELFEIICSSSQDFNNAYKKKSNKIINREMNIDQERKYRNTATNDIHSIDL